MDSQTEDLSYLDPKLEKLVNYQPVMVIIKGTPDLPRCKFSRETIEVLNGLGIQYATFNILADEKIRQRMKEWSDWPTYPQIYVNGELIGGLDLLKEQIASGEFMQLIPESAIRKDEPANDESEPTQEESKDDLNSRLKKLINKSEIMIFIKGTPASPCCGFSNKLVTLISTKYPTLKYDYFDILSDETVRQGLKVYSDWPTFPQVYIKGELVGGLDIIEDMISSGEFDNIIKDI